MFERVGGGGGVSAGLRLDPAVLAALPKAERLAVLREQMVAVPDRVGANGAATVRTHDLVAMPGALGELMPDGGLMRGTVVGCPQGAVLCAVLAAASGAGLHSAVVAGSRLGLLSAWEMGAELDHVALVDAAADRGGSRLGTR